MTIMEGWSHGVLGYLSQTENVRYNFQIILSSVSDYMYLDCTTITLWHYLIYTFSGTDTEKFRIEYEWGLFKWNPLGECSWLRKIVRQIQFHRRWCRSLNAPAKIPSVKNSVWCSWSHIMADLIYSSDRNVRTFCFSLKRLKTWKSQEKKSGMYEGWCNTL